MRSQCRLCKRNFAKHGSIYYFLCKQCLKKEHNRVKSQNKRKNKAGSLAFATWMTSLVMHDFRCRFCDGPAEKLDHIVSMYNGGNNSLENIQPLCDCCNNKKTKIENFLQSPNVNRFKLAVSMLDDSREFFEKLDFAA